MSTTAISPLLGAADPDSIQRAMQGGPNRSAAVVAAEQFEAVLVRQYRHPVRDWTIEVPAGSVSDGEAPLDAARRELAEEVGGHGGIWIHLTSFFSSSAHLDMRSDAFLATGVAVGRAAPDEDEEIGIVRMPAGEAIALARATGAP